jgi:hypothetical protein
MATYITPLLVAKEALIALENNMVLGNLIHRGYSKEFQSGTGSTVVVRAPTTFSATAFTSTVAAQTVTESSVSVILNTLLDVSFELTSQDLSRSISDMSEQLIQPAMRAHAPAIDATIAAVMSTGIAGYYPVTATPVVSDIANLGAVQDILKVPMSGRRLVLHPATKAAYISLDAFLHADKRGDGGKALRTAEIGNVMGYETYMDQNITTQTRSFLLANAAAAGTGTLTGACAAAATSCTVTGATAAAVSTAPIGTPFKFTGYDQWFYTTVPCTAGTSGIATVTGFAPAVAATMADTSVVTFQLTGRDNLAFHKNAFTLVTAPLQAPIGGAKSSVVSYNGLSCRVVWDYAQASKTNLCSIDMLFGVKMLNQNLAARLIDKR